MTAYVMHERYPDDTPDVGEDEAVVPVRAVLTTVRKTLASGR